MKKIIITTLLITTVMLGKSQSISQITMHPTHPTTSDTIYFYVDLDFPSADCRLQEKSLGRSSIFTGGTIISAYAYHCRGLLTTICHTTDTFIVTPLERGNHAFNMYLEAGFAGFEGNGCTPINRIDDRTSFSFSVDATTGVPDIKNAHLWNIYPNPSNGEVTIKLQRGDKKNNSSTIRLVSSDGKKIDEFKMIVSDKKTIHLPKGFYFIQLFNENELISTHKIVILQ